MNNPNPNEKIKIGEAELEVLRAIAETGPATVREVSDRVGTPRGLARTTVQRMMDRLLAKGLLEREELDGGFQYRSTLTLDELRRRLFEQFVNSALGGSLQPFAAYLSGSARLTPEEKQTLEALIQKAESQEKDKS